MPYFLTFQVVGWVDVFSTKDLGKYSFGCMKSSLTKLPHDCMVIFARFNLTFEKKL